MAILRNRKNTTQPVDDREVHLVTGGGGFAGFWLGKRLAEQGHRVILLDIREPMWTLKPGMEFRKADVSHSFLDVFSTHFSLEMFEAFSEAHCVYHMASFGMSGREQLNRKRIEQVNVQGTKNVIEACLEFDIPRLVYTSTYNVVFGGQTIEQGTEALPYLPLEEHPDHYSRTKSMAEMEVLKANGSETKLGNTLHTCALRLAAVYGPGETRHIPRIVNNIEQGLFCIKYGEGSLQDFLHVENLAQGHRLAAEALTEEKSYVAAGQAYFLSDDAPINTFNFFKPLIVGLGYTMPWVKIPVKLIYFIAFLTEWLHYLISWVYNFQPLLTRTEVYKTAVTHYFSIQKAQNQLGYKPTIKNDLSEVVQSYIDTNHKLQPSKKGSSLGTLIVNAILCVLFASLIMSCIPVVK